MAAWPVGGSAEGGSIRVGAVMDLKCHAGAGGSFSILRFQERDLPGLVDAGQLTSAAYLEQRPDVEHYLAVVDQLSGEALTPAGTIRFIEQVAAET